MTAPVLYRLVTGVWSNDGSVGVLLGLDNTDSASLIPASPRAYAVWAAWLIDDVLCVDVVISVVREGSVFPQSRPADLYPKVTTPVATLGPEALAPAVSRSWPH